jgi:hypothetical protein
MMIGTGTIVTQTHILTESELDEIPKLQLVYLWEFVVPTHGIRVEVLFISGLKKSLLN